MGASIVMRSAMMRTDSISCVTTTIAMLKAELRFRIRSSRPRPMRGSRPALGSSQKSTCGSIAMARAKATRLTWPPDSWFGIRFSKPARLTSPSFMRTEMSMIFEASVVCSRSASATFSATVSEPKSAPDW